MYQYTNCTKWLELVDFQVFFFLYKLSISFSFDTSGTPVAQLLHCACFSSPPLLRALARILKIPHLFERVSVQSGLLWSKNGLKLYKMVIFACQKQNLPVKMMGMAVPTEGPAPAVVRSGNQIRKPFKPTHSNHLIQFVFTKIQNFSCGV